ncbi:MAG TPA: sulfurtransferase complex subunit TusB [Methanotrichaceae archaeon]|nr:MAG: DsrH like protein [Methanosaeta sp. PtaU1.Bin028]HOT06273.1 sulfurtransferase complex subunit TusB [Methanotrichaceae archaeon]HQF15714.1 sulfurtransferase complex subunit TusB [Methanotrichaceae archaeon]HQI90613.1 sulfurtransferase complex subunit TusB [Methanotrichaceae archaeon]
MEIFFLTKPPRSDRTELCLRLLQSSNDAAIYLAGDGIYNLLEDSLKALPPERIMVCKEDMQARGVAAREGVAVPDDFYERLVEDLMREGNRVYTF